MNAPTETYHSDLHQEGLRLLAEDLERHKNDPVPMCHFQRMAFDCGEEPCNGWYECRVCGHIEETQEAWDKAWTRHYRKHARPSALIERYATRVRYWKDSNSAGQLNVNVVYYFGRHAREQGKSWRNCGRFSYEGQRIARLGYVDAARNLMHLRTEWVGEFGTGLTMTKPA